MTPQLPDEFAHNIQAADGYIDLRMLPEAYLELSKVPPEYRPHPAFQSVLLRHACEEKDWHKAAEIGQHLCDLTPDDAGAWIQYAYATRRATGIQHAQPILERATILFPTEPIIPYNMACYACQEGDLERARNLLSAAAELFPDCRNMALEDEDLKPLWPELEEAEPC